MRHLGISSEWLIILPFALAKLLIHVLTASNFGFHKDEFFYLYLGNYPDVGYFSSQPMTGLLSMVTQDLFGNSSLIMRTIPAIFGALSVVVIGRIVKLINGGNVALSFSLLAYLVSPVFLRTNVLFTPDFLDQFFWLLSTLLMVRLLKTRNTQNWILLSLVMGAGMLTKWSIALLLGGFVVGLLLTKERILLWTKDVPIALGTGLLIISPSILWHYDHHFPYWQQYDSMRIVDSSGPGFLWYFYTQIFTNLPGVLLWVGGLFYAFTSHQQNYLRTIGFSFVIIIVSGLLLLSHPFYLAGIYPVMLAIGSKFLESWLVDKSSLLRTRMYIFIVAIGLPLIPLAIPLFQEGGLKKYGKYLKGAEIHFPFKWQDNEMHAIPQFFGKMQGWEILGDRLTHYWYTLPEEERENTVIIVEDHKIASCVDYFARKNDLPLPICFRDNFILHNPDKVKAENIIYIGNHPSDWLMYFETQDILPTVFTKPHLFHDYQIYVLKDADISFAQHYAAVNERLKRQMFLDFLSR